MSARKRIVVVEDRDTRLRLFREWFQDHDLICSKTVGGGMEALLECRADYLYLDFDLHDPGTKDVRRELKIPWNRRELDGLDVAKFTVCRLPEELKPKLVVVHSRNPAGASVLLRYLIASKLKTTYWRFNYEYGQAKSNPQRDPER